MNKELSIVAPFYNEEDLIHNFIQEVEDTLSKVDIKYEIILVNDGSTDLSGEIVDQVVSENDKVFHIKNKKNLGIWKSWHEGVKQARYESVCIIDSDLQYQPQEILNLFEKHLEGYQFVQGVRKFSAAVGTVRYLISKILSGLLKVFFYRYTKKWTMLSQAFL